MRVVGLITRRPRSCWAFVFSCVVALTFPITPTSAAGGVVVVGVDLSDNADDDGFADTNETVSLRLTLMNTSGVDLTGVVARLRTDDRAMACITDPLVSIGELPAGETLVSSGVFSFTVSGNVERTTLVENLTLTFDVSVSSDQNADVALRQSVTVALDLDASGGASPGSFFESFESGGFGTFTTMDLDLGLHGTNEASDGYRCQYKDPDYTCGASYGCVTDCFLGATATQADAYHWQTDGPSSEDGGRAFSGTRSLYMGVPLTGGLGHTTPLATLEAAGMEGSVHVGLRDVCSETRTTLCQSEVDCPTGESCVATRPTLSVKQQISLVDSRTISNSLPGRTLDRAVVQAQVVDGPMTGVWVRLEPYLNGYDAQDDDQFSNCGFDPIDDGNTEDDVFHPSASPRYGPSSTCYPEYVFAYAGDTDDPFDAGAIGGASDGPGLAGSTGTGTWTESRFDLSRFRGRSIRLRFLTSSLKGGTVEDWEEIFQFNPDPGDDGWWIDDVQISDTLTTAALATIDTHDNSGLPNLPDTDADTVYDPCDNCPDDFNPDQVDSDADGAGDACDTCPFDDEDDADSDAICGDQDNCVDVANADQADSDADGLGDACDNCPETANCDAETCQVDSDADGLGDACDNCPVGDLDDSDADGVGCVSDNCPDDANTDQLDSDADGAGDACDTCPLDPENDQDLDGVCGDIDNCPSLGNPDQSPAVNFSGSLAPSGEVRSFETSDDGRWVVFRASIDDQDEGPQLYSRRLTGGPRVKLHGSPTSFVAQFQISPDSTTVVSATNELVAGPIDGGPRIVLDPASIQQLAISPDGFTVVYSRFFCSGSCREDLYSVPIDGSAAPLPLAQDLGGSFTVSPDSSRVVFLKYRPGQTLLNDLHSVPTQGGAIVKLNPPLVTNGTVARWAISGDSSTVAYWGDQDFDNLAELYTVPITGGIAQKLSIELATGSVNGNFDLNPEGTQIVFSQPTDGDVIYSVPITGGTPVPLSPSGGISGSVEISPDGATVVFEGEYSQYPGSTLFAIPILGGATTTLSAQSGLFQITPDGLWVVYAEFIDAGPNWSVFRVPIDGSSSPVELSTGGSGSFGGGDVTVSPDSATVVFRARQGGYPEPHELYAVETMGGPATKLNGVLAPGGSVSGSYAVEPNSTGVFYLADQQTDEVDELYLYLFDPDRDGDGIFDVCDPCLLDPSEDIDADGLCADVDNCPFDANPGQADTDGDGQGDACDCAPTDPDGLDPDEVKGLTASKINPQTVEFMWNATVGADRYAVTRGELSSLGSGSYGTCSEAGTKRTEFTDGDLPATAEGYGYLVHGLNSTCGPGTLGQDSSGTERINADPGACP